MSEVAIVQAVVLSNKTKTTNLNDNNVVIGMRAETTGESCYRYIDEW